MKYTPFRGRRWAFALLAALIFIFPGVARSDEDEDLKKEIASVEKQLAELKKKLDDIRGAKTPPLPAGALPENVVSRMTWRCIGPANMGGRITALAVVESEPTTYYVATASGGLLKTVNNGTTFSFVFDKAATVSIGDVAVAPSDPNVLYLGTGENNPRNSVSYGDGIYKSTDAGKTWNNVGLKKSFQIGKIVIHPKDPNTVYVAALGRLYGPNEERGVFKTTDGGRTWKKSLYVDDKTGAIELAMDPNDPNTLLAGLWEHKRDEFDGFFGFGPFPGPDMYGPIVAHGPGGGLFKTADGGATWKKLTGEKGVSGLPTVKTGRIGLDFSRKTKGLVYAIIDTEDIGRGHRLAVYLGVNGDVGAASKDGAKLTAVADGGPAAKAGLKTGDVVTEADGKKVGNYAEFLDLMELKKPDDVVKLTAQRAKAKSEKKDEKETLTVELKLAPKASEPAPKSGLQTLSPGGLGFSFDFNAPVTVTEVPKGGAAEKAGVKVGMTVVGVEGKDVANGREFRTELRVSPKLDNPRKAGEKLKLAFRGDDKKSLDVVLTLETTEVRGPGAGRGVDPNRPNLMSGQVGGQKVNLQKAQGKEGFQTGGVYASKDGGETWSRVNSLNPRPFYFSNVRADPTDEKTVYVLGDVELWKSADGGEKFESAGANTVHPDHHALWINPRNARHMLLGCDGGFYATYDRGATWDHINTQALAQFYHVAVDNRKPYRVYGGLQDNGSWGGPSRTLRDLGPANEDWQFLNGGDGFVCRVDPHDPDWVYCESQNGFMNRRNLKTGETRGFRPAPAKGEEDLRFNWNTPYILSSHNPQTLYCGAQYVYRSVARGDNLKRVSPELTRTKKGSMTAIAESPKNADVLWAGTDDGHLWVTQDGGANWTNVTDNLKKAGVPGYYWVSTIEPGNRAEGRCYVCLDAHRSDDDKPYLLATDDFGATWKSVTGNLPAFGSTRVLREDATRSDLLYCGTEFGFFVSLNRGETWTRLNNNLPTVAVHEVAQPTTAGEIVIATHGRGIWILDVTSLRQLNADALKAPVTFFAPATITRWQYPPGSFPYSEDVRKFRGTNPPPGGAVDYHLGKAAKEVTVKVFDVNAKDVSRRILEIDGKSVPRQAQDGAGRTVRGDFALPATAGLHRFQLALPRSGAYRVVLTVDGTEFVQMVTVENDPNAPANAVLTDGPEVLGEGNEPKRRESEGEAQDVTPFIPRAED